MVPAVGGAAGAVGRAGRGLLRQGLRRHLPRPAAHERRPRRRARSTAARSPRCSCFAALCLLAGILPGFVIDALAPVAACAGRRSHAGADRACRGSRSCRSPRAAAPTTACSSSSSSPSSASLAAFAIHRFASRALRRGAGLGLRLPRSEPGDAVHRRQLRPADPPRVRHPRVPRPRAGRDAAARRPAAGALHGRSARPRLGGLYAPLAGAVGFAAERLNHLQFLTIRRYLSLVFVALVALLLVLALWP